MTADDGSGYVTPSSAGGAALPAPGEEVVVPRSGVVVGVDGSRRSWPAVRYAARAAAHRRTHLTAVLAWSYPLFTHPVYLEPPRRIEARAAERLSAVVAEVRREFPDLEIRAKVVRNHTVDALVSESASAELLVVGSHRRGPVEGLLLGSVGKGVLRRSACPVVLVPSTAEMDRSSAAA